MQWKIWARAERRIAPNTVATDPIVNVVMVVGACCSGAAAAETGLAEIARPAASIKQLPFFIIPPSQIEILLVATALLLALIELSNSSTLLTRMARALKRLARIRAFDPELEAARSAADAEPSPDFAPAVSDISLHRPPARLRLAEGA